MRGVYLTRAPCLITLLVLDKLGLELISGAQVIAILVLGAAMVFAHHACHQSW